MSKTEYMDKYCGAKGGGGGGSGGGGGGSGGGKSGEIPLIKASEDEQPVGGKSQAKAAAAATAMRSGTAMRTGTGQRYGLPVVDEAFVATVYSESERGTHRMEPGWRDPRWSNPTRIDNSTLYETSERDPPHRQQFHVYKSTLIDPLETPCQPMAVPDVHKLRYMHNNYMTCDDWY